MITIQMSVVVGVFEKGNPEIHFKSTEWRERNRNDTNNSSERLKRSSECCDESPGGQNCKALRLEEDAQVKDHVVNRQSSVDRGIKEKEKLNHSQIEADTDKYFTPEGSAAVEKDIRAKTEKPRVKNEMPGSQIPPIGSSELKDKDDVLRFVEGLKSKDPSAKNDSHEIRDGTRPKTELSAGHPPQERAPPETTTAADLQTDLDIDSMVKLRSKSGQYRYGVIKWLGRYNGRRMVGLELVSSRVDKL